jgi:hypothetical protein
MKRFRLILLVFLMLMLSTRPLRAQEINPQGLKNLADIIRHDKECALDLKSTERALNSCNDSVRETQPAFWQKPGFIVGGVTVVFTAGLIFGLTRCLGACR